MLGATQASIQGFAIPIAFAGIRFRLEGGRIRLEAIASLEPVLRRWQTRGRD